MQEYENYQVLKLPPIEYSAIDEKEHHVFFRIKIKPTEKDSNILIKIKNSTDNYIFKFLNFKLFESPDQESEEHMMLETLEGVHKNLFEKTLVFSQNLRLNLKAGTVYYLVLEGILPYSL